MTPAHPAATEPVVRKAQLTGGSTFTVSLPKDWAEAQGLQAGAELWLYALEDRVVVAPAAREPAGQAVTVDADCLDGAALARRLQVAYTAGYETIAVSAAGGLDGDRRRTAARTLGELVGLDVDRGATDGLVARSLLDTTEVSPTQTRAQLRRLATAMHEDAATALVDGDAGLAATVRRRRADVDRQVALLTRQFTGALVDVTELERLRTSRETAYRHARAARELGRIADQAAAIAALAVPDDGDGATPNGRGEPLPDPLAAAVREACDALLGLLTAALEGPADAVEPRRRALEAAVGAAERTSREAAVDGIRIGRATARYRQAGSVAEELAAVRESGELAADGAGAERATDGAGAERAADGAGGESPGSGVD